MKSIITAIAIALLAFVFTGCSIDYHVSKSGFDGNPGTKSRPFKTNLFKRISE